LEIRALVPIAKGSEVFTTYKSIFEVRATRRESLMSYGFFCQCEVCGLPDHLSDARDAKLKSAKDALDFLQDILFSRKFLLRKADVRRGLQCVRTYFSFVTQERTFDDETLMIPIFFFAFLGLSKPMRDIGEVLHPILMRYWGPGHGIVSAKSLSRYLNDPRTNIQWEGYKRNGNLVSLAGFDDLIQKTVSSIITSLRNFA
jgi:hypothetical protein